MKYEYEGIWGEPFAPRDIWIDKAREKLTKFFRDRPKKIFYLKQLEVFLEKSFYHWITAKAVNELIDEGILGKEKVPLGKSTKVKFIFNKKHRYYKRQIKEQIEIIKKYSNYEIASACGRQAEVLFFNALTAKEFIPEGQNINKYRGKKWTKTSHDLDWIMERDNVPYGCEVKNTWDYIDRKELDIKLEICQFLGIKPLFIMRYSPKSYNKEIIDSKGYAMIFEAHIYPFGQRELVSRITNVLRLPADCPRAIPNGIINRFTRWHNKNL